jgi:hypothetical protein
VTSPGHQRVRGPPQRYKPPDLILVRAQHQLHFENVACDVMCNQNCKLPDCMNERSAEFFGNYGTLHPVDVDELRNPEKSPGNCPTPNVQKSGFTRFQGGSEVQSTRERQGTRHDEVRQVVRSRHGRAAGGECQMSGREASWCAACSQQRGKCTLKFHSSFLCGLG